MVAQQYCQRCELVHPPGPCPDPDNYTPDGTPPVDYIAGYAQGLAEGYNNGFNSRPEIEDSADCDGGCPDCIIQPRAYVHGYNHGKITGHHELRQWVPDVHPQGCGCEPCITVRILLARLNLTPDGSPAAPAGEHPDFPGYPVCRGCQGPDDGHFPDCIIRMYAKCRPATPEESAYLAQWVAEHTKPADGAVEPTNDGSCPMNDGGPHVFERDAFGLSCAACAQRFRRAA